MKLDKIIKILVGIASIPLMLLGLKAIIEPSSMIDKFGVDPMGPNGLNTIRGIIGGTLLSIGLMLLFGLKTKERAWLLAAALILLVISIGRAIGLGLDGIDPKIIPPLIGELIFAGLAFAAAKHVNNEE